MEAKRGPWGTIFLVSGLFAIFAGLMSPVSTTALAVAVVLGLVTVYAGYRIWRAAHPTTNFRQEFSRRTVAVITFVASVGALMFASAYPQVVLIIIGVWVVVIAALFASLALAQRGVDD